jgi:RNA polymerase sigma factor (sigma-70 family)
VTIATGEHALLERVANDLDQSYRELVERFADDVYSALRRISKDPRDAEDLASETFLHAYAALRGYSRARIRALQPRAWLMTIALNCWRNGLRTASRRPATVALETTEVASDPSVATEEIALAGISQSLGRALEALSEQQRIAVVLRHVVGCTTAEVALALEVPEATARSHVARGLARLRAELSKEDS